ncbi:MAG: TIGR03936 family radical SAM-associated protein [Clostridia bacterium]|nr:TIGR03936 family radical SAM-associated protein [Clostridia bacterium]
MKNIRIWFKKTNTARYISHLDLSRCMARAIRKAHLPFWYTEGFNPHVFLTITMPLSLGYTGMRESMDVKLLDDDYPFEKIISGLNSGLPDDVQVFDISELVMKPSEVEFAEYQVELETEDSSALRKELEDFLSQPELLTEKKTKKGFKTIDIKPDFEGMKFDSSDSKLLKMNMILKSSNNGGINPRLFMDLYMKNKNIELFPNVIRLNCFDKNMREFV